ncbi:MAG: zinc ribbon domain-containing protein [Clostridia bacterium]|nr:zinc ribbon domain-containing protein [Clostridia bacterium]
MKICPKCNAQLGDNMTFCPTCGTVFSAPQQQPPVGGYNPYSNPQQQPPMGGYNPNANPYANPNPNPQPNPMAPALPMNWYKFLIYFMLFASAALNVISGIMYITGSVYSIYGGSGANAEEIYRYFPNLKTVDIIYGLFALCCAGLAIYARFALAGFKRNGPALVLAVYAVAAVANLFYVIGFNAALGEVSQYIQSEMSQFTTSMITSLIVSVVVAILNLVYFNKRKHLFVN